MGAGIKKEIVLEFWWVPGERYLTSGITNRVSINTSIFKKYES